MEKYAITTRTNDRWIKSGYSKLYISLSEPINFDAFTTLDQDNALIMDKEGAEAILSELDKVLPGKFELEIRIKNKNIAEDLNGLENMNLKIITELIQEMNPVKFSQDCEDLYTRISPELVINCSLSSYVTRTPMGEAIVLVCAIQHWATEDQFLEWRASLMVKNKLSL